MKLYNNLLNSGGKVPKLFYFAYGSNLHPLRLQQRVPSARSIGVIRAESRRLTFSKRSIDQSGKCNFYETESPEDVVFGVLYEIDASEKAALDKAEGKGNGYNEVLVSFELEGKNYTPFTYVAASSHIDSGLCPYNWYKEMVVLGAQFYSFPVEYIEWLENAPSLPDPDPDRVAKNEELLQVMKEFNKRMKPTNG